MIFDRLKAIAAIALTMIAALGAIFGFYQKAKREEDERKDIEAARATEAKATDALVAGVTREQEDQTRANTAAPDRRHFE